MKRSQASLWTLAFLGSALSCGREAPVQGDPTSEPLAASPTLHLAEAPDFSLSEAESGTRSAIFNARHAAAFENGIFVVAHAGPELIYLDSTGVTVHVGQDAEQDPARPASVYGLFGAGDEVVVWDSQKRMWWYSDRGEHLGNVRVPISSSEFVMARGYLLGIGLVVSSERPLRSTEWTGEPRRYRVYTREGDELVVIEGPPQPAPFVISDDRTEYGLSAACAARPHEMVLGQELFAADAAAGILFAIDARGGVREVYRTPPDPVPMSGAQVDSIRRRVEYIAEGELSRVLEAGIARVASVGDPLPAWTGIIPDPTGRLWLRRQECFGDLQTFDIIRRTGEFEGSVEVPGELTVRAVYGDRVLVVRRDELGVEHLEQYRIVR